MRPRLVTSSALIACTALVLIAAPAHAQLGKLQKLKDKAKEQVDKMDPKATGKPAPNGTATQSQPANTSNQDAAQKSSPVSPQTSEPSNNGEITAVPVYPGAQMATGKSDCCGFWTKDPLNKVIAYYDQNLGVKGRDLDEMAKTYPIWKQQADAYRQQLPGLKMYTWLYAPDRPEGGHLSIILNPRDNSIFFDVDPRHLAAGSPLALAEYIKTTYRLQPLGDFKDAVVDEPAEANPADAEPDDNTPVVDASVVTEDIVRRLIRIQKAERAVMDSVEASPAMKRMKAAEAQQRADEEMDGRREAECQEQFSKLDIDVALMNTNFRQRFCTVARGRRISMDPEVAKIQREIDKLPRKAGGIDRSSYAVLVEKLFFYREARVKNGNRRPQFDLFTDSEIKVVERHWTELAAGFGW